MFLSLFLDCHKAKKDLYNNSENIRLTNNVALLYFTIIVIAIERVSLDLFLRDLIFLI